MKATREAEDRAKLEAEETARAETAARKAKAREERAAQEAEEKERAATEQKEKKKAAAWKRESQKSNRQPQPLVRFTNREPRGGYGKSTADATKSARRMEVEKLDATGRLTVPQQAQPKRRMGMPDFMPSPRSEQQKQDIVGSGIWGGGGSSGRKPLQYREVESIDGEGGMAASRERRQVRGFDESGSVAAPRSFPERPPLRQYDESRNPDSPPPPPPRRRGFSEEDSVGVDPTSEYQYKPLDARASSPQQGVDHAHEFLPQFGNGPSVRDERRWGNGNGNGRALRNTLGHAWTERPYEAQPVNTSSDYYQQPLEGSGDEGQGDTWHHLRRRNSAPSVSAQKVQQQPIQSQSYRYNIQDQATIDSQFANFRRQRDAQLICHLCGQQGHWAVQCPNVNCPLCGQAGHRARECPSSNVERPLSIRRSQDMGTSERSIPVYSSREPREVLRRDTDAHMESLRTVGSGMAALDAGAMASGARRRVSDEDFKVVRRVNTAAPPASTGLSRGPPAIRGNQERDERGSFNWRPNHPWQNEDRQEPEAEEASERRARRTRRGFEDAVETAPEPQRAPRKSISGRRAFEDDDADDDAADEAAAAREERAARKAARQAQRKADKVARQREQVTPVNLPEFISVSNLAQTLGVHYDHFVERLEDLGYDDVFPGKVLNAETSGMIAMEYSYEPIFESASSASPEKDERDLKPRPEVEGEDKEFLPTRPPVVTIMGHVDHGKTTILDFLRKSSVAAGEAGGITQHIGAFSVPLSASGKTITFLDTPGHAAFLAMRQRGANVTDIVILVVAADDSVKPQTLESLRCAREAGVPIIVAVNKVDKPEADVQRVKQDLARHGVEIEDFGGDTQVVPVSGKTGEGMEELEEAAVTLSEILDQRAETGGLVEGWVLEATTKRAGRVATVLIKRGTLRPGAVIVAGRTWARVKTLRNEGGKTIGEVGPGMPVEVDGWRDQPSAGDQVLQADNEQKAGSVVEYRREKEEREKMNVDMEAINEARRLEQEKRAKEKVAQRIASSAEPTRSREQDVQDPTASPAHQTIPFLIKADVSGSAEAVAAYVPSLTSPLIAPSILSAAVGPVHESDVELASATQAHIIAFNLPPDENMKGLAESRGVKVLENNIIYRVLDDVKAVLEERLPPVVTQRVLGEAEISAAFEIGVGGRKKVKIAGCKVRNGVMGKGNRVRVLRGDGEKIYDGAIDSLKNVKKDVQEMRKGSECGMGFDDWEGFEVGDQVQTYEEIREKRKL